MSYQNIWDASKAVIRGEFIGVNVYFEKEEKYQSFSNSPKIFKRRKMS